MNNTYLPTPSILGQDIVAAPAVGQHLSLVASRYGEPVLAELHDDDGQISCVCGFNDDDGNTVACDGCNRWQHTICYYPDWEGQDLPEELQHFCVDCRPKPFDAQAANDRQRRIREQQDSLVNGTRRPPAKSHKKKVKDSQSGINGWVPDKTRHDRNSASPRDQQPPTKRPKTNHRISDTNTSSSLGKGHNRKRTASNVNHHRSHSHSPETLELYSPELLRCYRHDDWAVVQANLHTDIGVTSALTEWLRAPDDEFRDLHGHDKRDILMRWDGQLDDIPGKAQIDIQEMNDEASNAIWKVVTVKEPVAQGAYLGELKGHVGFLSQYKEEPANRWAQLRHPEPFVFFHPSLPVYIDARHEGTELRYVRRSCRPNAKLQILVTDQTDYRFCFMALEQIDPGVEIALAWDTAESVPRTTNGFPPKDMAILSAWVSTVLANCGPCACNTVDCFMSRFDRRRNHGIDTEEGVSNLRAAKTRKKKQRQGRGTSPVTRHVSNSRSGSEHHRGDMDDEATDLRSTSGSGRGSVSRDITPSTHYSITGGTELSERERKKLAKEEEMFKRQAEEQIHRQGKKKRNSSGVQVNAQSPALSKASMNPSRNLDAGTQRQPTIPPRTFKKIKSHVPAKQMIRTGDAFASKRHSFVYTDHSTQADLDEEDARHRQAMSRPARSFISRRTYLFQYLARRETKAVVIIPAKSAALENEDLDRIEGNITAEISVSTVPEIVMPDYGPTPEDERIPDMSARANGDRAGSVDQSSVLDDPVNVPSDYTQVAKVEWSEPSKVVEASSIQQSSRSLSGLYIPSGHDAAIVANTTGPKSASSTPISNDHFTFAAAGIPIFSPSVTAAITPSPARKKLSLSDYTKRSKAKDKDGEGKVERDSSPASTASGSNGLARIPVEIKAGEHILSAAEDTKMEDVLSNEIAPSQA